MIIGPENLHLELYRGPYDLYVSVLNAAQSQDSL